MSSLPQSEPKQEIVTDRLVTCISFDYFGKMMALSTADQHIEVWEKNGDEWVQSDCWQAHNGTVLKVRWAHPEFGNILASCSNDRTVMIWEQKQMESTVKFARVRDQLSYNDVIEDIQFAPKHLGLQLAVCISNGEIKILEADLSNLASWNPIQGFETSPYGSNCLAWSTSSYSSPMIVVGNNDQEEGMRKFPHVRSGPQEVIQLWGQNADKKGWDKLFVPKSGHNATVTCVDWAPLMGRRNHMIASSSTDGSIVIWKIGTSEQDRTGELMTLQSTLNKHQGPVWRVCWDILGTCLSSAGEDRTVKVWKRNLQREWVEA